MYDNKKISYYFIMTIISNGIEIFVQLDNIEKIMGKITDKK